MDPEQYDIGMYGQQPEQEQPQEQQRRQPQMPMPFTQADERRINELNQAWASASKAHDDGLIDETGLYELQKQIQPSLMQNLQKKDQWDKSQQQAQEMQVMDQRAKAITLGVKDAQHLAQNVASTIGTFIDPISGLATYINSKGDELKFPSAHAEEDRRQANREAAMGAESMGGDFEGSPTEGGDTGGDFPSSKMPQEQSPDDQALALLKEKGMLQGSGAPGDPYRQGQGQAAPPVDPYAGHREDHQPWMGHQPTHAQLYTEQARQQGRDVPMSVGRQAERDRYRQYRESQQQAKEKANPEMLTAQEMATIRQHAESMVGGPNNRTRQQTVGRIAAQMAAAAQRRKEIDYKTEAQTTRQINRKTIDEAFPGGGGSRGAKGSAEPADQQEKLVEANYKKLDTEYARMLKEKDRKEPIPEELKTLEGRMQKAREMVEKKLLPEKIVPEMQNNYKAFVSQIGLNDKNEVDLNKASIDQLKALKAVYGGPDPEKFGVTATKARKSLENVNKAIADQQAGKTVKPREVPKLGEGQKVMDKFADAFLGALDVVGGITTGRFGGK